MSISSAARGFLPAEEDDEVSFSFVEDDVDDELEYRPSTRLERHHAPTRWRGILCGLSDRHFSIGSIPPAVKITSRAEIVDLSLPLLLLRGGTGGIISAWASLVAFPPAIISDDDEEEDTAAMGIATDTEALLLLLLQFSDISFVTSAAAAMVT